MNSITTTKLYPRLDKVFNITGFLANKDDFLKKYVIPRDMYDYLIQIAKSSFKGMELNKWVVKDLDSGIIQPVFFADPPNPNDKILKYPSSISSILTPDRQRNDIKGYFDVSIDGSFTRNKATRELESFKMTGTEKKFFVLAQRAFINRFVAKNSMSLNTNPLFVKTVSSLFARLFSNVISGQLGGSSKGDWMQRVNYIALVFALQNFFDYDMEKARNFAFAFQSVDKAYIMENCNYWNYFNISNPKILDMKYSEIQKNFANATKENKPYPIDIFISILSKEFQDMRKDPLEYRNVLNVFTSRYGPNSVFAIEHGESLLNMVITATGKVGIYNDLIICSNIEPFLPDLYRCIIDICSRS